MQVFILVPGLFSRITGLTSGYGMYFDGNLQIEYEYFFLRRYLIYCSFERLQMWISLSKLTALPDDTLVYCGHEYTMVSEFLCGKFMWVKE